MPEGGKRVLVTAIRAIGDLVLITPILRLLKQRVPASYLAVIADGLSAEVLRHNPHVDRIVEIDRRAWHSLSWLERIRRTVRLAKDLRNERFDVGVDLFSGPRSAWLMWLSGSRERYGEDFRSRGRGFLYTQPIKILHDGRHLVEQKLELVHAMISDAESGEVKLELFLSEEEQTRAGTILARHGLTAETLVGLVPGAGSVYRQWPADRFAAVGDRLARDYGAQVVLLGGPEDVPICRRVAQRMECKATDLSGTTTLRESLALLREMGLVISNVTGPMHIAVALDKPKVIALFGGADICQYAPWGATGFMLTKGSKTEAYWDKIDYEQDYTKYLMQITTNEVCGLAQTLLGRRV